MTAMAERVRFCMSQLVSVPLQRPQSLPKHADDLKCHGKHNDALPFLETSCCCCDDCLPVVFRPSYCRRTQQGLRHCNSITHAANRMLVLVMLHVCRRRLTYERELCVAAAVPGPRGQLQYTPQHHQRRTASGQATRHLMHQAQRLVCGGGAGQPAVAPGRGCWRPRWLSLLSSILCSDICVVSALLCC